MPDQGSILSHHDWKLGGNDCRCIQRVAQLLPDSKRGVNVNPSDVNVEPAATDRRLGPLLRGPQNWIKIQKSKNQKSLSPPVEKQASR